MNAVYLAYCAVYDRMRSAIVVDGDELAGLALFQRTARWRPLFREAATAAIRDVGQRFPRRSRRHFVERLYREVVGNARACGCAGRPGAER